MFDREDFINIEITDGEKTRPPYSHELDAMVQAANLKLQSEINKINEMRGLFPNGQTTD